MASALYAGNARPRRGRRVNVAPKYARRGSWGYIRLTQLACSISVRCSHYLRFCCLRLVGGLQKHRQGLAVSLKKMADFVRHRAERIRHALESSVGACPSHPKRTFSCKRKTLGTHGFEGVSSLLRVWLYKT